MSDPAPTEPNPSDLPYDQQQPLLSINVYDVQLLQNLLRNLLWLIPLMCKLKTLKTRLQPKMVTVDVMDEGKYILNITFSKEVLDIISQPWKKAIVVKLLGKSIRYQIFCRQVQMLWKPKGDQDILDLGHDFFLVKFDLKEDLKVVLFKEPWIIQDHYLTARKWHPEFVPSSTIVESTLAWVRFLGLSMVYYDDSP